MSVDLDTRKLEKQVKARLFEQLNQCTRQDPILLLIQPSLVPYINALCTFSELTKHTQVSVIMTLDESCLDNLNGMEVGSAKLVVLLDVRSDLKVPDELHELIRGLSLRKLDVISASWKQHTDVEEAKVFPDYLQLQLKEVALRVHRWYMLPVCYLDDQFLNCNVLRTSDGQNMYYPATPSLAGTTRTVLVNHLKESLVSLCLENDITITHSVALGSNSRRLVDALQADLRDLVSQEAQAQQKVLYGKRHSGLETDLIVFERQIDNMTPLLSQLTYAGMLNDVFTFTADSKLQDLRVGDVLEDPEDQRAVLLDYKEDGVWNELKYVNFGAVGTKLNTWAKELKGQYDARHQVETVGEIKRFVSGLGDLQQRQKLLKLHTGISSKIMEHVRDGAIFQQLIETEQDFCMNNLDNRASCERILDLMYSGAPKDVVLRLCCLLSLTKNGIRDREFLTLKTEILDAFGIDVLPELERLSAHGLFLSKTLFPARSPVKDFQTLSAWYDICPQLDRPIDPLDPREPTFTLCGVIPLSVRILQSLYDRSVALQHYSSQQPFVISRAPSLARLEPLFTAQYGRDSAHQRVWDRSADPATIAVGAPGRAPDLALLVFVGGVTPAELATIAFFQRALRAKDVRKRFVVLADGLLRAAPPV
ncbi:AaceriAER064Cp [[Ashbya] aceris (nom. inval.)]|nr:AaceriAER064Cp [[Ashbya] aceris (nom. inval.)]